MNMLSVFGLDMVGEAEGWNSVWLLIDDLSLFVYVFTAENKTR